MEQYEKMYLYKRIVQAKLFIDKHYGENIDLSNIANEAHFSKFHFIRLFSALYGKTPHNYLKAVRIDRARVLLSEGVPVFTVCCSVGFESPTSFTAVFKKMTGKTPSEYQAEQSLRKQAISRNPLIFVPHCFAANHGWEKIAISKR